MWLGHISLTASLPRTTICTPTSLCAEPHTVCCTGYCCTTQFPSCRGNNVCCPANGYPVTCSTGCCPAGYHCGAPGTCEPNQPAGPDRTAQSIPTVGLSGSGCGVERHDLVDQHGQRAASGHDMMQRQQQHMLGQIETQQCEVC